MEPIVVRKGLRLSRYHLFVWVVCWVIAAGLAAQACHNYNTIAGTDKTPQHIAAIAVGVVLGPEIGLFANSGTFGGGLSWLMIYSALLFGLFASLTPFVFVKKHVSWFVHLLAWCGYLAACVAWFGSSILSIGHFLS